MRRKREVVIGILASLVMIALAAPALEACRGTRQGAFIFRRLRQRRTQVDVNVGVTPDQSRKTVTPDQTTTTKVTPDQTTKQTVTPDQTSTPTQKKTIYQNEASSPASRVRVQTNRTRVNVQWRPFRRTRRAYGG